MATRNSHGQLTLTGFLATLNPTDLMRTKEILTDSGLSSRVSVKTAVLHPNIVTRYKLLASLLEYDAANQAASDLDIVEDSVDSESSSETSVETSPGGEL